MPGRDRHARNVLRGVEAGTPGSATRVNALDHVMVVLFENRSLDDVLGLYGPGDGKAFEGVIGEELSNPIPGWAIFTIDGGRRSCRVPRDGASAAEVA